jgi:acetolactate synthase-1/2/3 large subunit
MNNPTTKLSDYVFQFIADQGVRHIFLLPGGGAMHLVDSLGKCEKLGSICNLHEQACAIAAEAYARVTNNLGVALVTTGPGGTNAITGVAGAWLESTPCLFISGQVKRTDMKRDIGVRQLGPQELDIVTIVQSITKYAVTVTDPSTIRYHLEKALFILREGRKGPVWIDIPLDVQAAQINPNSLRGFQKDRNQQKSNELHLAISQIIALLNLSERPVLLLGNGVRSAGAEKVVLDLVTALNIPTLTTWMGADLLSDEHPLFFGKPGTIASRGANFTVQNSDCLISIGARLDAAVMGFDRTKFARQAKKIIVDIDNTEIAKLGIPIDLSLIADAKVFIDEFLKQKKSIKQHYRVSWFNYCRVLKQKYPIVLPEYWNQKKYVNTFVLSSVLSDELTETDLIIPGSSGAGIDAFWLAFRVKKGQRLFSTGGLGAMGFGLPAAIGGCLASGGRRTISVDGDGGFQLNIQELETVARLNLPIKFFIINNNGYASIRSMQRNHFKGHLVACDESSGLSLPDVKKQAKAYGIKAFQLKNQKDLSSKVRNILDLPGPVICDVLTDPDQSIAPRSSSTVRSDGCIVSKPLEDLWPFLDRHEFIENMLIPPIEE